MKNNRENQFKSKFQTYLNLALILMIIYFGMNKFVFNKSTSIAQTGGGGIGDIALEYYFEKYPDQVGNKDVEVKVQNFGCHQDIFIYKDGNKVMRMIYEYGKLQELN